MKKALKILSISAAILGSVLLLTSCKDKVTGLDSRTYPSSASLADDGTVEFSEKPDDAEGETPVTPGISADDARNDLEEPTEMPEDNAEEIDRGVVGQNLEDDVEVDGRDTVGAENFPGEDYTGE